VRLEGTQLATAVGYRSELSKEYDPSNDRGSPSTGYKAGLGAEKREDFDEKKRVDG
jgi:hypothetical protein